MPLEGIYHLHHTATILKVHITLRLSWAIRPLKIITVINVSPTPAVRTERVFGFICLGFVLGFLCSKELKKEKNNLIRQIALLSNIM